LPYFYAALSRNDLSYVAGEFRIFGAIFLEDGCSLFECHINLFELGKVLYCEVFNFVGGRLFWATFFWAGLMAWGLPGIGFLATGLLGMAEKTSALIEAEATRKNHRHPIGIGSGRPALW
jgi:hypothetical protein